MLSSETIVLIRQARFVCLTLPCPSARTTKMKKYISEGRAMYEDANHGLFSKRLAEWAIGNMRMKDPATDEIKPLNPRPLDDVHEVLEQHQVKFPSEFIYTAWYLFNMAMADYPKALKSDEQRATFVEETICDPDCCPEAVLDCFEAKMCAMGVPIHWERML